MISWIGAGGGNIKNALESATEKNGGLRAVARVMGGDTDAGLICSYRKRFISGQHIDAREEVWSRFWKALGPLLPPEYAPMSSRRPGQGGAAAGPFAGRPAELSRLCEYWNEIPEESREMLLATIRARRDGARRDGREGTGELWDFELNVRVGV